MKVLSSINLNISKRQKIVLASILISISLAITQSVNLFTRQNLVITTVILAFLLSLWALWAGMSKLKAFTLLTLPTLYTLGVITFYFLLPVRWLTKLPVDLIFGMSFYFLLLSQNIFNVSAFRTIPLYRVATAVSFLVTIFSGFLLFHVLHALSLSFILNGAVVGTISFLLILPALWSIDMEGVSKQMISYSIVLAVVMGEVAMALSFWPIPSNSLMWSIMLSSFLFILLGVSLDKYRNRLTRVEAYLYLGFGVLVFWVTFLTISWSG